MISRALICLLCLVPIANAEVQLDGIVVNSDGSLFSLVDTDTKNISGWIRVGDSFEEYRVVSYDQRSETLVLRKMATEYRITLRPSKVRAGKPGFPRDIALRIVSKHFSDSKFIIRAQARLIGKQWYYRCGEVWKTEGIGPSIGEIFLGPTLGTHPETQRPLTWDEAAALFDHSSPEELLFMNEFPSVAGKQSGGMPMSNGRLNLCPDVPLDDLRALLANGKANHQPELAPSAVH